MNINNLPEKYLSTLDAQDIKKIFPDRFYTKYASHLKILEFQKKLATKDLKQNKGRLKFTHHDKNNSNDKRKLLKNSKGVQSQKKVKTTKYDDIQYIINKNKEQIDRMNQYKNNLRLKLTLTPPKKDGFIRIHRENIKQPQQNVIQSMNILQKEEYEKHAQKVSKKKKSDLIKFTKKNNNKKDLSLDKSLIRQRSQTKTHIITLSKIQSQSNLVKNVKKQMSQLIRQSSQFNQTLNPQNKNYQLSYIVNLNNTMKQGIKILKKVGLDEFDRQASKITKHPLKIVRNSDQYGRKDLSKETQDIRLKAESMKIQKGYDQLDFSRKIRKFINNEDNKQY